MLDVGSRRLLNAYDQAGLDALQVPQPPDPGMSLEEWDEYRWRKMARVYAAHADDRKVIFPGPYPWQFEVGYRQAMTAAPSFAEELAETADRYNWDFGTHTLSDHWLLYYSQAAELSNSLLSQPPYDPRSEPNDPPSYWGEAGSLLRRVLTGASGAVAAGVVAAATGAAAAVPTSVKIGAAAVAALALVLAVGSRK